MHGGYVRWLWLLLGGGGGVFVTCRELREGF